MWTEEQLARWAQGKFKMAEREQYTAWQQAGKPTLPPVEETTEPKQADLTQSPAPVTSVKPEANVRRDEEGERYVLPEGFEWFEDTWLGDVLQDTVNYVQTGITQRRVAAETAELLTGVYDSEDVTEYIEAVANMQSQEQTHEMQEFNRQIEENGGGFFGVLKAAAVNPTAAMGIMVTSLISMTTPEAIGAGAAVGAAL